MLRTEFETDVNQAAFNWYATTDDFKVNWDNMEEFVEEMQKSPTSLAKLYEQYWNWYFTA